MKDIKEVPSKIKYLFTDIDDTLTDEGMLHDHAYTSLWSLYLRGVKIVPITGRPAGWCEMIARLWPVDGVIGENGAFYFAYNRDTKKMQRHYVVDLATQKENQKKLHQLKEQVLKEVPGSAVASDQFCRLMDVAIDFCEDVPALKKSDIEKIVRIFTQAGATAKVSSIHVNAWFGDYDKLSMCKTYVKKMWGLNLEEIQDECLFSGDSPNDEPMFAYFKNSIGVANIKDFLNEIQSPPKYICNKKGGEGFKELSDHLLTLI